MKITELATGIERGVSVKETEEDDFKKLTKKRYFFDWKLCKGKMPIYKLCLEEEPETILGVVAIIDIEDEKRIEINLIASSKENTGRKKKYDGIAGCLIAFVGREAVNKYRGLACVSLVPKTELINHYQKRYRMQFGGWQMYLEGDDLNLLINEHGI